MTKKRDVIDEILSKKSRLPFAKNERWDLVSNRLARIRESIHLLDMLESTTNQEIEEAEGLFEELIEVTNAQIDSSNILSLTYEISRYIPIGLVSCLEGYFRVVYANLLDFGSPYRERVNKLDINKSAFTLDTIFSLEQSRVSAGEFAAHILKTSSLDDINNIMEVLTGENFLEQFKREFSNSQKNQIQMSLFPMDDEDLANQVIIDIKRLFELRHMYAHEIDPPIENKDFSSIWRGADATFKFIWNTERILERLLAVKT